MPQPFVFDVDETSFEEAVLHASYEVPVVVDFWAAWCGPCRFLGPVLESLAAEAGGAWRLAKLDVDANPRLAAAFRIQGIPAVKAFRDGREVGSFVGALPEDQVRVWLRRLGPTEGDVLVERGRTAEAAGDLEGARARYREALDEEPGHAVARAALERVELDIRAANADEATLRGRLAADPGDVEAVVGVADLEASRGRLENAFDLLLEAVRATSGDERERARRHLLRLLDTVPADDPRALEARRSLSLALF